MDTAPKSKKTGTGTVIEALPNTLFRIQVEAKAETEMLKDAEDEVIMAYLAGKMRMNRIRVLIGDRVEFEQDEYGGRARIIRRL